MSASRKHADLPTTPVVREISVGDQVFSLNPWLRTQPLFEGGRIAALRLVFPRRSRVRTRSQDLVLTRDDDRFHPVLRAVLTKGAQVRLDVDQALLARLVDAGLFLGLDEKIQPPRFQCRLDDALGSAEREVAIDALCVNTTLRVFDRALANEALTRRFEQLATVACDSALLELVDPVTDVPLLYWLGPEDADLIRQLSRGDLANSDIPPAVLLRLIANGVLVDSTTVARRRAMWGEGLDEAASSFAGLGYAEIDRLLHPAQLEATRRYFDELFGGGYARYGDGQVPDRFVLHNEPVSRYLQSLIQPAVERVVGHRIVPSYTYSVRYTNEARLERHTDRAQCEVTLTMLVDYEPPPQPDRPSPWPIHVEPPWVPAKTVFQRLGSAVVYKGCEVAHSRGALASGHESTSLLAHFVSPGFTGSLD